GAAHASSGSEHVAGESAPGSGNAGDLVAAVLAARSHLPRRHRAAVHLVASTGFDVRAAAHLGTHPRRKDLHRRAGRHQPFAGVPADWKPRKQRPKTGIPSRGERRAHMIQSLAARIHLAKMQAEEGQALIEYALIVSLISVIAIAALTL